MKADRLMPVAIAALMIPVTAWAQDDGASDDNDFGVWTSVGAVKKIDKKLSVGVEGEMRLRDDASQIDRWSIGANVSYKLTPWLKASAGYVLIDDHVDDKYTYHTNGNVNKWTPDYWRLRHRVHASLTGSLRLGRLDVSLRERWQYTYRPEKVVQRWDEDDEEWGDKTVGSMAKNVLRSRLQLSYNIPHSHLEPYASTEIFNAWNVQKSRYTIGAEYKITKQHVVNAFYRYQHQHDRQDEDPNMHVLGVGYTLKF